MDKYEYNLKLEEIDKLVDQGDYGEAANLADTIEWKRVRNIRTLCLISEIYEAAGRLEDSRQLLERAYKRSPVGKNVLYRLVEVTTALQQYDEAIEYYTEYVQVAPHDNNRYILKYKIYKGRGNSVEELISILEEYLGQEYTERWAYELAKLYRQAGQMQKCLAACDDLVLWFHSGKYVRKALELKKKYTALTPKQKQIYEECLQEETEEYLDDGEDGQQEEETAAINVEGPDGDAMAEKIIAETEKEIAEEVSARKAEMEKRGSAEELQREEPELGATRRVGRLSAERFSESSSPAGEKSRMQKPDETAVQKNRSEEFQAAGSRAGSDGSQAMAGKTAGAEAEEFDQEKLQMELARSMREIISGVVKRTEVPEEDLPASVESELQIPPRVDPPEVKEPSVNRLSIDDILLSMGDKGKEIARKAAMAEAAQTEEERMPYENGTELSEEQYLDESDPEDVSEPARRELTGAAGNENSMEEEAPSAYEPEAGTGDFEPAADETECTTQQGDRAEGSCTESEEDSKQLQPVMEPESPEQPKAVMEPESPESLQSITEAVSPEKPQPIDETALFETPRSRREVEAAREKIRKSPARTVTEAAAADLTEAQREALQYTSNPEKLLRNRNSLPTYREEKEDLGKTRRVLSKEELMEAAKQEILAEKTIRIPVEEIAKRRYGRPADQQPESEMEVHAYETDGKQEFSDTEQNENYRQQEMTPQESDEDYAQELPDSQEEYPQEDGAYYDEAENGEGSYEEAEYGEEPYDEGGYDEGEYLTIPEHLRNLFSGFTEIPELEDQIANAIIQAEGKGDDRTSRSGNILIFGAHGSGKTTIAMNLAKAIAQDRGNQVMKLAKIYASDLNKKDIAATVAKIAGGTLIIEEAGDLEDGIVEQLTTAMEFRTDGLIVILEDEQKYIHELLMRHPRFTMKFTAQVYIPEYTVEELAMFGQIYANAQDYVVGEEGLDALYGKISAAASEGNEVTIKDVIDMVSRAIGRSNKFFRKMKMGKKRYDENDYVILFAKDFK